MCDEPRTKPLPERLQLILNGVPLIPYCDESGRVYRGTWVLPGGERITTSNAEKLAAANGWTCEVILN